MVIRGVKEERYLDRRGMKMVRGKGSATNR